MNSRLPLSIARIVAWLATLLAVTASSTSALEFGNHPSPDPTAYSQRGAGSKYVMKFRTGSEPGITDSIFGFFHHNHNGSDTIDFVIYADNAGLPAALVDTATSYRVVTTTQAWYGARLTGQPLSANTDYWLGVLIRSGGVSLRLYDDGTSADSLKIRADTSPPDNPFGSGAITTVPEGKLAIYVKYWPSSPPLSPRRRSSD